MVEDENKFEVGDAFIHIGYTANCICEIIKVIETVDGFYYKMKSYASTYNQESLYYVSEEELSSNTYSLIID